MRQCKKHRFDRENFLKHKLHTFEVTKSFACGKILRTCIPLDRLLRRGRVPALGKQRVNSDQRLTGQDQRFEVDTKPLHLGV